MVSQINFGNFSTIGGKTITTGLSSGLNSKDIMDTIIAARKIPVDALETRLDKSTEQVTTLGTLKTALTKLQGAVDVLRNAPGFDNAANNIFEYRQTFLTSNTSVSGNTYLGVTASPGSTLGTHDITVVNLAEKKNMRSAAKASKTTDLGLGNTSFNIQGLATKTITLSSGDTLSDIKTKVNAVSTQTGVVASIVQVSSSDFRLVLESKESGTANTFTLDFSADAAVGTSLNFSTIQGAENAEITVDGISITRSSNTIDDVLEGITFSLYQETPDAGDPDQTVVTLETTRDTQLVVTGIKNFVDAYNEFKTFAAEQQERDSDGTFVDTAILQNNLTLRTALDRMGEEAARIVDGITDGDPSWLFDAGISFVDQPATDDSIAVKNTLLLDEDALTTALETDFDKIRKVFEFSLTSDSGKITTSEWTNDLAVTDFTITVNTQVGFSIGNNITSAPIFGSNTAAGVFTTLTDGDQFKITVTDEDDVTTDLLFTYMGTPVAANEFNSLNTLAAAIEAATGTKAQVSSNKLVIWSEAETSKLTFANTSGSNNFLTGIGLSDTGRLSEDVVKLTYDSTTVTATYTPTTDKSTGNDITTTAIFGSSAKGTAFSSGLADGDGFRITVTNPAGITSNLDFIYKATPVAANEFNSLNTLATAIEAATGTKASVQNNKLIISAEGTYDTLSFTNLNLVGTPDFVTAIGLENTEIIGGVIEAPDDSSLQGLGMFYEGDGTDTLSIHVTQGIAARLYNTIGEIIETDGVMETDIEGMETTQDTIQSDIDRLNEQIERFRQTLLEQFAALEEAVSSVNSILGYLEAQTNAQLANR